MAASGEILFLHTPSPTYKLYRIVNISGSTSVLILAQKLKEAEFTEPDSRLLTRNLLRIARELFQEKYFNDKAVPALDMKPKKLMPIDAESRQLIDWMDKGLYDVLLKYLKTLLFCIFEEYAFSFSYSNSDNQEVAMIINCSETTTGSTIETNVATDVTANMMRSSACKMVWTLIQLMRTLHRMMLEERCVLFKLLFNDDVTACSILTLADESMRQFQDVESHLKDVKEANSLLSYGTQIKKKTWLYRALVIEYGCPYCLPVRSKFDNWRATESSPQQQECRCTDEEKEERRRNDLEKKDWSRKQAAEAVKNRRIEFRNKILVKIFYVNCFFMSDEGKADTLVVTRFQLQGIEEFQHFITNEINYHIVPPESVRQRMFTEYTDAEGVKFNLNASTWVDFTLRCVEAVGNFLFLKISGGRFSQVLLHIVSTDFGCVPVK